MGRREGLVGLQAGRGTAAGKGYRRSELHGHFLCHFRVDTDESVYESWKDAAPSNREPRLKRLGIQSCGCILVLTLPSAMESYGIGKPHHTE
jgi:hypothetical protein